MRSLADTYRWLREASEGGERIDPDEVLEILPTLLKKQIEDCELVVAEAVDGIACHNCCDIKAVRAFIALKKASE